MTTTNVGDINSLLDKVSTLLKSDIKTLVDNIDLLEDEYKTLPVDTSKYSNVPEEAKERKADIITKTEYAYKIINDFTEFSKEISSRFIYTTRKVDENEVISYIVEKLGKYGMLDISFSTKGKITIDLKHCDVIEEL